MIKDRFYYQENVNFSDSETFLFVFEGIRTKAELLDFYNQQLKCPYFGYNWDALKDCLIGLREWIPKKKNAFIHRDITQLKRSELSIYVYILQFVCEFWEQHSELLKVKVYFPKSYQEKVWQILQENEL